MVLYPNPAGGSMEVSSQADAISKGWSPSMGTFGQAAPGGGGGGIGQNAPAVNPGAFDQAAFSQQMTQAATPFAQATSGVTAADLAERKRQFDAQLEWTKQMWAQQGLPQLQIQQQAAALAQKEFESQKQIAAQNYQLAQTTQAQTNALGVANLTGYYNAPDTSQYATGASGAGGGSAIDNGIKYLQGLNPTLADPAYQKVLMASRGYVYWPGENLDASGMPTSGQYPGIGATAAGAVAPGAPGAPGQGIQTLAGQQQGFAQGMDYLKTAASLGGPSDYFQQSNFLRGANAMGAPKFLQALQNNTNLAAFNAPGAASGAPGVQSMQSLAGGLSGAQGNSPQSALNSIGAIGAAGGQALAPQAWEQMNPDEQALFSSGMKASGFSMPSFLQSYQQSRIGQGASQAA